MSAPSKRVDGHGRYYDIFGRRVQYRGAKPHNATPRKWDKCEAAASVSLGTERQVVLDFNRGVPALGRYREWLTAVLPCCYEPSICSLCMRKADDHDSASLKCVFGAGFAIYSLSAMDIYCPGWEDRYVGD